MDPGGEDGLTRIEVTLWDTAPSADGTPTVFERFTLQRPRRDRERERQRREGEAAPAGA